MKNKIYLKLKSYWEYVFKTDYLLSIVVAIVVIALSLTIGLYNNKVVPVSAGSLSHYTLEPNNPLKALSDWDGPNYLSIASNGYTNSYQANFFPLYPLLVRLVNHIVPSLLVSGLIVSWACFIGAIYFYLKLVKLLFKLKTNLSAMYALAFFVLFPTGIFLIATYNTSLLALLSLGAIYYALKNRPLIASVFGFFDTLTHLTGVFVVILVALILIENQVKLMKVVYSFIISILGIGSYSLYLNQHFNNALAFISAQKSHGWITYHLTSLGQTFDLIDIPMLILILLSIFYWWSRRKSLALYSFLFLLIPIVGGQFGGYNRYCLLDFPVALMIYSYLRDKRALYIVAIVITVITWSYYALQYIGGYTGG